MPSSLPTGFVPRLQASAPRLAPPRRPLVVPLLYAALGLTSLWSAGTGCYLIFHDAMLARFLAAQGAMESAYERRVAALQQDHDRAVSDHTAASGGLARRIGSIDARQAVLEERHDRLSSLAGAGPDRLAEPAAADDVPVTGEIEVRARKPFPTPGPASEPPAPDLRDLGMRGSDRALLRTRLDLAEARLDRLAARQAATLGAIARRAQDRAGRYREVVIRTGLDPARFGRAPPGIGGPFVPVGAPSDEAETGSAQDSAAQRKPGAVPDVFERDLAAVREQVEESARLLRVADALPLRQPLAGEGIESSGFGRRVDPFTRGLAQHTGLDLRAEAGVPARASAAGRVTLAESSGGYGRMVEIDHGHGIATRYAHLSGFAVAPGQRVEAGTIIGRVGSTGRSTGSHLHYETRIDGEPVDPQRFLRAGARLVSAD